MTRQIGLAAAVAIVVGHVIAVGIFLTPASMARQLGSPFWLLIVWLLMGGMALTGALTYGELAARYPEAGGAYVYLREAWGPRVSFLYGWKCCLVMDPGITAALGAGLAAYAAYLLPMSPAATKGLAVATILLAAAVNIAGVRPGARLITAITVVKLGALAAIVVIGLGSGRGDWGHFVPFLAQRAGSAPLGEALAGALVGAFFAFGGWWEASKLAGEVRDPSRTVPRALALGVVLVTIAYILTSAAFLYLVPLQEVADGEAFAAQAGEALFGPAGGRVFASIVVVSVAGSLLTVLMALPRLYYAMSRDGLFPPALGRLDPRLGTPARAIALQALLASGLVMIGSFDAIVAYFIFVTVLFISMTAAGLYRLAGRPGEAPRYRTPGYPVTPALFLAGLVGMMIVLLIGRPWQAMAGVAVVAAGLPAYALLMRLRQSHAVLPVSRSAR
jgi:basic amino acid/polyamine antiporter, APA family